MDFLLGESEEPRGLGGCGGKGGGGGGGVCLPVIPGARMCVFVFGAPLCKGSFVMMATGNLWGIRSAAGLSGRRLTGGHGSAG